MLSCWNEDVTKRPTFKDLQTTLDRMLAARSDNTYIDFSINPENLCYQVADEADPPSDKFLRTESLSTKRRSKIGSRPDSGASNIATPSACLKEASAAPKRFARTPSPTIEKPHATKPSDLSVEGEGRRPRSMMLLQGRSEAPAEDDR